MAIEVEVAYAAPSGQTILNFLVPTICTISQAIVISGVVTLYPELGTLEQLSVGIFGKLRSLDWNVKAGDRIEIYRPLAMDPMQARKVRAKQQSKNKLKNKAKKTQK